MSHSRQPAPASAIARSAQGRNTPCACGSGRKFKQCCGVLAVAPETERAQTLARAAAALRENRVAEAERLLGDVLARHPDDVSGRVLLAVLAGRTGRAPVGVALLREAIHLDPREPQPPLLLANLLRDMGQREDAITVLEAAVGRLPGHAPLLSELGLLLLQSGSAGQALQWFDRAVAADPGFAVAHYNRGCALERGRRIADAAAAYRRCLQLEPRLAEAHSRLGNLLHAQGRRAEAVACFKAAADAAPERTIGRLNRAKVAMEAGDAAAAETHLRAAIAADPRASEAHRLLGSTLRELGRFEDAEQALARAVAIDPEQIAAFHDLAHSKKMTAADDALIATMRERLAVPSRTDHERSLLHFALGKACDDLGAAAQAIAHFDTANRLERAGMAFDRDQFARFVDWVIGWYAPGLIAPQAPPPAAASPVLIIGMPRSGTTLVEQIISAHPDVAGGGELLYWTDAANRLGQPGIGALDAPAGGRLAAAYRAVLSAVGPSAASVTDKNPFNFIWAGLIHLLLPDARFVHCRRDPVDTCLSIFFTRFATRQEFAYDRDDLVFYYGQYRRLVDHWRAILPRDRFLDVDYEDVVAAPGPAARRLIAFCGLPWDDACLRPERNRRLIKTASLWQARQPVYRTSVARWQRYAPWLGSLESLMEARLPGASPRDGEPR